MCNTPTLLEEIISHWWDQTVVFQIPLRLLYGILQEVAQIATKIDDKELNQLMMRLSLYDISDPRSKNYDSDFVDQYLKK